jgi:hypothetical protein
MMTVFIGEDKAFKFEIYRGILCFHSEYFKKLLDGPFMEGGSNEHCLTDVSYETITMFFTWICTGTVTDSLGQSDSDLSNTDIVNLYVFADFHMVQQLKNRAVELFFSRLARTFSVDMYCTIEMYEETSEGSPIRKLHVDILMDLFDFDGRRADLRSLLKDFIIDLFEGHRKRKTAPGSLMGVHGGGRHDWIKRKRATFCKDYHEHDEPEQHPTNNTS